MFDAKPGPLEGSECLMSILSSSRGHGVKGVRASRVQGARGACVSGACGTIQNALTQTQNSKPQTLNPKP